MTRSNISACFPPVTADEDPQALLAEVRRLRIEVSREHPHSVGYTLNLAAQLEAWQACADQLRNRLRIRAAMLSDADREALAAYESLKGGQTP